MATYESLIKITGSVGDLVFYTLNGKNIVRKKSGFNKTAFKKSPTYEKVRQNSSEFGHCSKVGKIIRLALDPYIKAAEDPLLYQSFAKLMTEIKDLDLTSEKGKRTIRNGISGETGKGLLRKFQFGKLPNLENEALISFDLWENNLKLDRTLEADEVIILSIKVDVESYLTEKFEEVISLEQQTEIIRFEKHFSDDDLILYCVVIKNNGQVSKMGFV
ncbi:hypothetical protein [Chryseobacterium paridis]|uniref:Uncharacterized protein n=1 Tax=Chryseobacterium paridis TaxID=2800328 RepID=A0ABS1FVM9_9FLAO|nr:hypothetical protein [Chryseobacterium paridis]MBK1896472.1 hypothetical protein [Chryseobacterium paridis]